MLKKVLVKFGEDLKVEVMRGKTVKVLKRLQEMTCKLCNTITSYGLFNDSFILLFYRLTKSKLGFLMSTLKKESMSDTMAALSG